MRDLAELVAGWIHSLRIMSGQQWVLRPTALASGGAASMLCFFWFPTVISTALLVTALMLAFASVIRPDSLAPLCFIAVVALWWLAGGGESSPRGWLGVGAAVAVFHLTTAFAAGAPSYARITGRAAVLLMRGAVGYVAVSVAVGTAVLGLTALPNEALGPGLVAVGALAVAAATVAVVAALRPRPDG